VWTRTADGKAVTYGDVRHAEELQLSVYNFEQADVQKTWQHLEAYEQECAALLKQFEFTRPAEGQNDEAQRAAMRRFPVLAAYDLCLKCSHLFNLLDARGAISVTERVGVIARIRQLAVGVAKAYLAQQTAASGAAASGSKA
jgi:glycyl-tRNA synthetase alpha chain